MFIKIKKSKTKGRELIDMKRVFLVIAGLLLLLTLNFSVFAADYGETVPNTTYTREEVVELYGEDVMELVEEGQLVFHEDGLLYDLFGNLVPLGGRSAGWVPQTGVENYIPVLCVTACVLSAGLVIVLNQKKKAIN